MRWNTQAEYVAVKNNNQDLIEENVTVTIITNDVEDNNDDISNAEEYFSLQKSTKFQLLAWESLKQIKPEWVPQNHRIGVAILPVSPDFQFQHVKLSHQYVKIA